MSTVAKDIPLFEMPAQHASTQRRTRILCVSDLGSQSEHALQRASSLARTWEAELLVLHVLSEKHSEQVVLSSADRARLRLCVPTERAIPDEEQPAAVQIRRGKPHHVIKNTAREWNAELLVIAAPQPSGIDRLFGTTEERLLASVNIPVLIVRGTAPQTYRNVAVASDLLPPSMQAAKRASALGFFDAAEVTFIHAFRPPYEGINLGDPRASEQLETYRQKTGRLIEQQLNADIGFAGLKKYRTKVHSRLATEPEEGIAMMLGEFGTELMVMNMPRRFALKQLFGRSTASRILREARCDVLAVPSAATVGAGV